MCYDFRESCFFDLCMEAFMQYWFIVMGICILAMVYVFVNYNRIKAMEEEQMPWLQIR